MATATKRRTAESRSITSFDEWAAKAVHVVTLYSGRTVKMRIPDVGLLVSGDAVPQTLRNAAHTMLVDPIEQKVTRAAADGKAPEIPLEEISDLYKLHKWIVLQTVIEPQLTEEQLEMLPQEDLQLLTQLATRERTTDAAGRDLGTEPLSRYEKFREHHGCATSCEACKKVVDEFSTNLA